MAAILPGATIGILGGGQLGRMTAMAARGMGYHLQALDPDSSCAARFVVDRCVTASFEDPAAAAELAAGCDVVTLEIEKISQASLLAAASRAPLRPGAQVLAVVQDRAVQKDWLSSHGFPVGRYEVVRTEAEAAAAAQAIGASFLKTTTGGYDGKGQVRLGADAAQQAAAAFLELGGGPCVLEQALSLEAELSVLVARRPGGQMAVYPPALNHHERQILEWSVLPGPVSQAVALRATQIALGVAETLGVEGLLAVELFLLVDGRLLVNELAPRPHNTFHTTEVACLTSQFEQAVRAVCDLPLGETEAVRPVAIINLLGDLWPEAKANGRGSGGAAGALPPAFDRALELTGVRLHLYGKRVARPGRKMGHLSATAQTPEAAVALVQEALRRITRRPVS